MNTEEVIDILQGIKDGTACLMKNMPQRGETAIDTAIDVLSERRWIPVTERLPQTEEWRTEYIVTYRYGYEDLISDTTCMSWENTTVRGKPVSRWIWHNALSPWKVVAWMEKPKPYNGEIE